MDYVADVIYNNLDELFENESKALAIQLAYDYSFKDKTVNNPELGIVALLTEIYLSC